MPKAIIFDTETIELDAPGIIEITTPRAITSLRRRYSQVIAVW
jgi:hypothetical protein